MQHSCSDTAHEVFQHKFFIKDFSSKCDQIRSFHLLKKYLIENYIFRAVRQEKFLQAWKHQKFKLDFNNTATCQFYEPTITENLMKVTFYLPLCLFRASKTIAATVKI